MNGDFDLDTWLEDYEAIITEAKVVQKAALIAEHVRLEQALLQAQGVAAGVMHDPAVSEARRALRDCEATIAASQRTFTFRSVGYEAWHTLKRKHPPKDADLKAGLDVKMDTFAPAAIALFSHEPKITPQQAKTMVQKLPPGEVQKLYVAVLEANGEVIGAPKSVLAVLTEQFQRSVASSTTGLPEESPDADSSGTLADPSPES